MKPSINKGNKVDYLRHLGKENMVLRFCNGLIIAALLYLQAFLPYISQILLAFFIMLQVEGATAILHFNKAGDLAIINLARNIFISAMGLYAIAFLFNMLTPLFALHLCFTSAIAIYSIVHLFKHNSLSYSSIFAPLFSNVDLVPAEATGKSTPAVAYHKACTLIACTLILSSFVFVVLVKLTACHYLISTSINNPIVTPYLQTAFHSLQRFLIATKTPLYTQRYMAYRTLVGLSLLSSVATPSMVFIKKSENSENNAGLPGVATPIVTI